MHHPEDRHLGRALLLFAALMLGLALVTALRGDGWRAAALPLALGIFVACYGGLRLPTPPWMHRPLLVLGLAAGASAFALALLSVLPA